MIALHQHWLREAGAVIEPATPVEISPIFALDASELPARVPAGTRITAPTYLR
jgi:hypothetical protein